MVIVGFLLGVIVGMILAVGALVYLTRRDG